MGYSCRFPALENLTNIYQKNKINNALAPYLALLPIIKIHTMNNLAIEDIR